VIAGHIALGSAIGDMKLAAAVAATEQSSQQGFAAPHRAAARPALSIGVVADQALIPFELVPADITLVMVADQTCQSGRSTRKPRTMRLRPFSIVTLLAERPNA